MQNTSIIDQKKRWGVMQTGITKLKNIIEGKPNSEFTSEEYVIFYTAIHNMCIQKGPHTYKQQLYDKYRETFEEYITSMVLPSLREKHGECMLRELVKRWSNHKKMVRWLACFFHYLDAYFIPQRSLQPLRDVGINCFRDLVYEEIKGEVITAVVSLIDQVRDGEQIDRDLFKNVLDIFVEVSIDSFEDSLLKHTADYYSTKAQTWIREDCSPDYMLKAEECLNREKEQFYYSHPAFIQNSNLKQRLLETMQHELLSKCASQLLEKEH